MLTGLIQNREKQEIKTVRIVKRESERRQRDRGDRTGNIGIPLTNGLQVPGGAKRLNDEDFGGSQQFEVRQDGKTVRFDYLILIKKFQKAQLDRVMEESAMIHAQSTVQLSEIDDVQFQRSMSLPRGFGGQRTQPGVHQGPVLPPPRSDSMNALRNMMVRRHRVRVRIQELKNFFYIVFLVLSWFSHRLSLFFFFLSFLSSFSSDIFYSLRIKTEVRIALYRLIQRVRV